MKIDHERLARPRKDLRAATAVQRAAEANAIRLECEIEDLEEEERTPRLTRMEEAEAAAALRNEPVPDFSTVREELAQIDRQIKAKKAALALARAEIREAEAKTREARIAYNSALGPMIVEERQRLLSDIEQTLDGLGPLMAQLAATDRVQYQGLGKTFEIDGDVLPWFSGRHIVKTFADVLDQFPKNMPTAKFDRCAWRDNYADDARAIADRVLDELEINHAA